MIASFLNQLYRRPQDRRIGVQINHCGANVAMSGKGCEDVDRHSFLRQGGKEEVPASVGSSLINPTGFVDASKYLN